MKISKKTFPYGRHTVTIETGRIARQATAAVLVSMGDTVVLATVVGGRNNAQGDMLPLTVNYLERYYAAGQIPGGFFKREGRPTEKETLTSRLIDRPIRPLFPKGFYHDVQVVVTVMSIDPEIDPDIPALIGASAALSLSGIPFKCPIAAARVGYIDGQFVLNTPMSQVAQSQLDLVVAGSEDAVLMVESEAKQLPEDVMLNAVKFGHQQMQVVIQAIKELVKEAGNPAWDWKASSANQDIHRKVSEEIEEKLAAAYQIQEKQERRSKIDELFDSLIDSLCPDEEPETMAHIETAFEQLERNIVRNRVLDGKPRIDGRDSKTVRPIRIDLGVLPRTHGSALFTRGETQALVVLTLGTGNDAQLIDALEGERKDTFMLHYNFPPYSVGEVGMVGAPKRREIGHGKLAKRSIQGVLPTQEQFPYVMRIVSEITESNGSSSMASVCGSSLALMDAGVPIAAPVAGIAMGLVKDGDRFAVLTDIQGDEDHLGDMDFKVAGTAAGITALQMDIKITGVTWEIMETALEQAHAARVHILDIMKKAIETPRQEMSNYAPRIITLNINPEKIRDVIGKGGATIRGIIEKTGVSIDINDKGVVSIASTDNDAAQEAINQVMMLTADVEVGKIYEGPVIKIMDFGAFVTLLPGKDGLVHISQICNDRVEKVEDKLTEGNIVRVKVLEIDRQGRIRLTMKDIEQP